MVERCSNGVAFLVLEPEPSVRTGIRVDIYDGADPNTLIARLPLTWGRKWSDPLKGPGSGEFWVHASDETIAANPGILDYGNIARFSLDERYRFAIQIEHKDRVQIGTGGDVARTIHVTGRGLLSKLEEAALYPVGGLAGDPVRQFTDATPGEILGPAFDEAQARGALAGLSRDFAAAVDSNNAPYDVDLTLEERAGSNVLRIAERLGELAGNVYMSTAGVLKFVNQRGVDRSQQLPNAGPVILQFADNLTELTRSEDGAIRNALLIETPAGFLERSRGASVTEHGRRESFLSLGNIIETDAVDRAAESVFAQSADPAAQIGSAVLDKDGARPYVDWSVGDWVLAPDEDDTLERFRVRALTVSETAEGQPVFVPELATITEELENRYERWLSAMAKGTVGGTAGAVAEPVKAPAEVVTAIDAGIGDHVAGQPHFDELADLADTDTTGLADDDVLRYNAGTGAWEPEALNLDTLDDVDLTTPPTDGQVLKYDDASSLWQPADESGGGGGGGPGWLSYLAARQLGETVHADDDFFDDAVAGGTAVTVSGSATWTEKYDRLGVIVSGQTSGDLAARLFALTPSTPPVTIETALTVSMLHANLCIVGLVLTDGTSSGSNVVLSSLLTETSNTQIHHRQGGGTLTNWTADINADPGSIRLNDLQGGPLFLRLIWSASNTFKWLYAVHPGGPWTDFGVGTRSKTMTPTHFGVAATVHGGSHPLQAAFDYLRVNEADLS